MNKGDVFTEESLDELIDYTYNNGYCLGWGNDNTRKRKKEIEMTSYEAHERLDTINNYIAVLKKAHSKISNWNEEFGEGNPDAILINSLIKELKEEKDSLITAMKDIVIK